MTTYGQTKKKDDEFNFLVDSYLLDLYVTCVFRNAFAWKRKQGTFVMIWATNKVMEVN